MAELRKEADGRWALVFDHPRQAADIIASLGLFVLHRVSDIRDPMSEPAYAVGTPGWVRVTACQTVFRDLGHERLFELSEAVADAGLGG